MVSMFQGAGLEDSGSSLRDKRIQSRAQGKQLLEQIAEVCRDVASGLRSSVTQV